MRFTPSRFTNWDHDNILNFFTFKVVNRDLISIVYDYDPKIPGNELTLITTDGEITTSVDFMLVVKSINPCIQIYMMNGDLYERIYYTFDDALSQAIRYVESGLINTKEDRFIWKTLEELEQEYL